MWLLIRFWWVFFLAVLSGCSVGIHFEPKPLPVLPTTHLSWERAIVGLKQNSFFVSSDGNLWLGLDSGEVIALDPTRDRQIERFKVSVEGIVSIAFLDGRLFVVDNRGHLFALEKSLDKWIVRWDRETDAAISTPLFVAKNRVLLRLDDGRVLAFDTEGRLVWQQVYLMPDLVLKAPSRILSDGNAIYQTLPGGIVRAFDLSNGNLLWESLFSPPKGVNENERLVDFVNGGVLVSNRLCLAAFQGRMGCVNPATGENLWNKDFSAPLGVITAVNLLISADERGDLFAKNIDSGQDVWSQDLLRYRRLTSMTVGPAWFVVTDTSGFVHFFNINDGVPIARKDFNSPVQALGMFDGKVVLVSKGHIYLLDGPN
jgi:outer membrane protein assembly factor BamB